MLTLSHFVGGGGAAVLRPKVYELLRQLLGPKYM
jgi:hypothetical protein